jgi:hypothetical protein
MLKHRLQSTVFPPFWFNTWSQERNFKDCYGNNQKYLLQPSIGAHAYNPSTQGTEARGLRNWGQLRLPSETLSQKKSISNRKRSIPMRCCLWSTLNYSLHNPKYALRKFSPNYILISMSSFWISSFLSKRLQSHLVIYKYKNNT